MMCILTQYSKRKDNKSKLKTGALNLLKGIGNSNFIYINYA